MRKVTGTWATAVALLIAMPLSLAACTGTEDKRHAAHKASTKPAEPLTLAITPANGAKKQPVSTEIGTKVTGGQVTEVKLAKAGGGEVGGSMRPDGSAWVPDKPLEYGKTYTANVTARSPSGKTETQTTTFTTMGKPSSTVDSALYVADGRTYGVAMPVVVQFEPGIPQQDRAAVQKRMFVTTDPPQPGAWHWVSNGTQAYYRAPQYWQPGTTISVRIALEGIPLSNGQHGDSDHKASAKIGGKLEIKVENSTKTLSVYDNGNLIKTMPVSLGKRSTPSSSGTMVIMDKLESTVFDTYAELGPIEGYRTAVDFAQRLTWGGEFIHSAPWSVGDQGQRNVSHGCINLSPANAKWLFNRTKVGDPVTVSGTEVKLEHGNGWTAWNMSWAEFIKGSALPVPADIGATNGNAAAGNGAAPKPTG
jgi:lipoprotein-anchoring transpeptidase ErfK/SrfK